MRAIVVASLLALLAAPRVARADDAAPSSPPDLPSPAPTESSSAPAAASSAPPADASSAPSDSATAVASDSSAAPEAAPPEAPPPRPRRRRRRHHGPPRARGPLVLVAYRYLSLPTEGGAGATHAFGMFGDPSARSRSFPRNVRVVLGAEIAFRSAPNQHNDAITWVHLAIGGKLPGRYVTPYLTGVADAGLAIRTRFDQTLPEFAWTMGAELGATLRVVGFLGIDLAVGVGRTQIGDQWNVLPWFRAGLAFY